MGGEPPRIRSGLVGTFFNIIFYIQLWVRAGCGYAVPDPSTREKIDLAGTVSHPNDLFMQQFLSQLLWR